MPQVDLMSILLQSFSALFILLNSCYLLKLLYLLLYISQLYIVYIFFFEFLVSLKIQIYLNLSKINLIKF